MARIAEYLGIHKAITELGDGYATLLPERGTNLSYGQRQLVCLTRAIIADPWILMFDEATSSVDPYTEARIQETLRQEMMNRTIILVTHGSRLYETWTGSYSLRKGRSRMRVPTIS